MSWLHSNGSLDHHAASYYAAITPERDPYPSFKGSVTADLCIVGGGLTGLSAALHGAEAGLSVILLEAARIGWGASGRNGGQIASGLNWDLQRLDAKLGRQAARALYHDTEEARDMAVTLAQTHAPSALQGRGIVNVTRSETGAKSYQTYGRWCAETFGEETEFLGAEALAARLGTAAYAGGLLNPKDAFCNPLAFCQGLADAAQIAGVSLHERSEVHRIAPAKDHWRVQTGTARVRAKHVLHATNGLSTHLTRHAAARILPINNFIAVTEPLDTPPMPAPLAVADDRFVVNYFWQTGDGRLVYGGGESYGPRFPSDIAARVRKTLSRVYPHLRDVRIDHAWGGTLAVTPTRLPCIANPAPGLFIAGGYSGHGLALAPYAGRAIIEALSGDAARFTRLAQLPTPPLPGGRWLGSVATNLGLRLASIRDNLLG